MTSESAALRSIFFATTEMKKEVTYKGAEPLGGSRRRAGRWSDGGGIAFVTATKAGVPVRIKDVASRASAMPCATATTSWPRSSSAANCCAASEKQMSLLTGTLDYSGFHRVDMVVEAVFEDLALKHQMVKDVGASAANTQCLPPTPPLCLSTRSPRRRRTRRVVGLHYFSPVDKMPLAEIIPLAGTSAETVATTLAFARAQGRPHRGQG